MAKSDKKVEAVPEPAAPQGQGRAVILPNGTRRIDYIHEQYYTVGETRSNIKNAVNAMLPEGQEIAYQIVFAATKTKEDPRVARKVAAAEKAEKTKKVAEAAAEAAAKEAK